MMTRKIPCNKLMSNDEACAIDATVKIFRGQDSGYVLKGCECGRVRAKTHPYLPRSYRLRR